MNAVVRQFRVPHRQEKEHVPPNDQAARGETPEDRARRNVELLIRRNRQDMGVDRGGIVPRQLRSVGVIGAGLMGTAIAAANVKCDLPVVITDADEQMLMAAPDRIAAELVPPNESPGAEIRQTVDRLVRQTTDEAEVARCHLVLESVVENLPGKQQVYRRLEGRLSPGTILASNTSTIPIGRLAAALADRHRFLGIHFFHPVRHRPLVEIVRGPQTADEAVAAAVAYAKRIDKMPIVVEDGPGFLVNRLLFPYVSEALELLLDGATIDELERAAGDFGMAMGPLRILDEIGLDTALLGGRVLWEAFRERIVPSPLLITMVKSGRLGRKSGGGFFSYDEPSQDLPARPDPSVKRLIADWARRPQPLTDQTITDRLLLPMVLEATRLLEEKHVRDPRDVDLGVLLGLGFPALRGGLLYWADTLGATEIVRRLGSLESLGPRARPTEMLLEMAALGRRFYDFGIS